MDSLPMQDRNVSLTTVGAAALWVLGVALVAGSAITGWPLGQLGLTVVIGAATLTVRGYFVDLQDREMEAFEVGRKVGESLRRPRN